MRLCFTVTSTTFFYLPPTSKKRILKQNARSIQEKSRGKRGGMI